MIDRNSALAKAFWEDGFAPECPVLDFHAHMGRFYGGFVPDDSPEEMLRAMDRRHVALTCFCGHEALYARSGIERDLAVARAFPNRFKAYHIVQGRYPCPDEDIARVAANVENYVGFKFLSDYHGVPLSAPSLAPYWEYADAKRLLVLCHTWGGSPVDGPAEAEKMLAKYPNAVLIAGHSFFGQWEEAVRLAQAYPNLRLELTAVLHRRGPLELFVEKLGSAQILFGVDLPWFSYDHGIGAILSADIGDEARKDILFRNGVALLSRFPWFKDLWAQTMAGQV